MVPPLEEMFVHIDSDLRKVLEILDLNAQGIVFVVEKDNYFLGVITDGDILRSFLKGNNLSSPLRDIYNANSFFLPVNTNNDIIQENLSEKIRHIPLLNEQGQVVNYASKNHLHRIPVQEPLLGGNELKYVTECIKTNWISSQGSFVRKFEQQLSEFCQVPYSLAVSNGTVALHLALLALDIGPGNEVIVPDFTFAASINAIIHAGATPVLVDVHHDTWTIDPDCIAKAITKKTKAIMPVHIYGHPCHMDEIIKIAKANNLLIIEDCAEALGSTYKGQPVGSFGDAAAFSFFGNKVITTGEGGMVLFSDSAVYEKAFIFRDHGMSKGMRYWHEVVGYNYRMTNLQAAVGVAQMEQFDRLHQLRKRNYAIYNENLKSLAYLHLQQIQDWAESSYWLYTLLIDRCSSFNRDELIIKLQKNGIETRPTFFAMHMLPAYQKFKIHSEYTVSQRISDTGISLPSSTSLAEIEIIDICNKINSFYIIKSMAL